MRGYSSCEQSEHVTGNRGTVGVGVGVGVLCVGGRFGSGREWVGVGGSGQIRHAFSDVGKRWSDLGQSLVPDSFGDLVIPFEN